MADQFPIIEVPLDAPEDAEYLGTKERKLLMMSFFWMIFNIISLNIKS
ncbi:MAG: hypothetical protein HEQ35_03780 [Gloeotrichia echinulata IR180]